MKRAKKMLKAKPRRSSQARPRPERPKLLKISEEMQRWSALLGTEVATWSGVRTKPMFGFHAYYRGKCMFAGLPKTKAMHSPNSIIFKFLRPTRVLMAALRQDSRILVSGKGGAGWQAFEFASDADLRDALGWLDRAYRAAAP